MYEIVYFKFKNKIVCFIFLQLFFLRYEINVLSKSHFILKKLFVQLCRMVGVKLKKCIINICMNSIKKNKNYSETKLKEIEYGLISIYLTFTKIIFILAVSTVLNIFKEVIIFMIFFNIIRTFAFGLHATKSWICWISSTIIFIIIPLLCINIIINKYIAIGLCLICTLLIFKNAPADTKKRPIVSKKRRYTFKYISTTLSIIYSILVVYISNNFVVNCMIFALILQNVLISPATYKLFKSPYNNYIDFLKKHPDFTY